MRQNQLRTPVEALQFAIDFAQRDLEHASDGKLKAVEQGVRRLLTRPERSSGQGSTNVPPLDRAALAHLQAAAHGWLSALVDTGLVEGVTVTVTAAMRDIPRPGPRSTKRTVLLGSTPTVMAVENKAVLVIVGGPLRDRLLYQILRLLEQLGAEKLQKCPAPECGRLFFKVTRKEFCSTRCQSRVYMRGYREAVTKQKGGR
jgi:hypothetical protein